MNHPSPSKCAIGMIAIGLVNCGGRSALEGDQLVVGTGAKSGTSTGGSYVSATSIAIPIATGGTATQPWTTAASTGGAAGHVTAGGTTSATGCRLNIDDCSAIGSSSANVSLIDDMENGSGRILNTDGRVGAWYAFDSEGSNQWPAPTTPGVPIETSQIPNGRCSSQRAMHTYGDLSDWGGIGFDLKFDGTTYGTYDASAYDGITFWARGSPDYIQVRIGTAETTSTKYGGTCTLDDPGSGVSEGCQPAYRTIYLGDDFVQYWVPFATLWPPANSAPAVPFDQTLLTNVQFYNNSSDLPIDYWVDDVYFYGGVPGCCAASPPECSGICADVCNLDVLDYAPSNLQIPEQLRCVISLKELNLSNGVLSDVGMIANLTELYRLNLSKNQVTNLGPISNLFRLKYLALSSSGLAELDPLACLTRLITLDLSSNSISNLAALSNLTNLTSLLLNNNQVGNLEPLSGLTNLVTLNLSNNSIDSAASLSTLTALTSLDISHNQLVNTNGLATLAQLTNLNLSNNQLLDISDLGALVQLKTLSLSSNYVSDVRALGQLTQLHTLDLSNNQVTDPSTLSNLPNLSSLDLSNNQVSDLANFSKLPHLSTLDLSGNQISNVRGLLPMTSLTSLKLSNNLLNDDSDLSGLATVQSLSTLNLSGNQISNLRSMPSMTSLSNVDLSDNFINDDSDLSGLAAIQSLSTLNLSGNQMGVVASDVSKLTHLMSLDLSNNQIDDVSNLAPLRSLWTVNLSGNQISDVGQLLQLSWPGPGDYGALPSLDVSNNNRIDCTAQAANIKALRAKVVLKISCPCSGLGC